MAVVLVWFTIAMIKNHDQKKVGEEKIYLVYVSKSIVSLQSKSGQELKLDKNLVTEDVEAMEEWC